MSHATAADVEARVEVSATPVYVIAQGKGIREQGLKRVLDRVADVSGGRSFYTERIEELEGVFAEISQDIASQYLLAYDPGEAPSDGIWRAIRVGSRACPRTTPCARDRDTGRSPSRSELANALSAAEQAAQPTANPRRLLGVVRPHLLFALQAVVTG